MADTVTIDRTGRVVIPKPLRDALGLEAGDTLEVAADGAAITLRARPSGAALAKEQGVWVLRRGGDPLTVTDINRVLSDTRSERGSQVAPPDE